MGRTKQIENGKKVNFILSGENQGLLEEYANTLPPGTDIKTSAFYNEAIKRYLELLLKHC